MNNDKQNKRNKRKNKEKERNEIDEKEKNDKKQRIENITKNYLKLDAKDITKDIEEKIQNYYLDRIELAERLKDENNLNELYDLAEISVFNYFLNFKLRKFSNFELENFQVKGKFKETFSANDLIKSQNAEQLRRKGEKDKYNAILMDKIKQLTEEKNKILTEENEKRNQIIKETENFVKDIQNKYQEELPERQMLLDENQKLRKELDESIKYTIGIKEMIENQKNKKLTKTKELEHEYKNNMSTKMEYLSNQAQKYLIENSELKTQIIQYQNKNEEMQNVLNSYNKEYQNLMQEVEKVN